MILNHLLNELGDRLKVKNIDDEAVALILIRKLNESSKEIGRIHDWDCLKYLGSFNTVPNYTTGTATVTNGSRTVMGSGTSWTSAMVGRHFKSGSNWYKIVAFVSSTELVLETPINEVSGSGTYVIWKRFYYLPSQLRKVKIFGRWLSDFRIEQKTENHLIDKYGDPSAVGSPEIAVSTGVDPFTGSYEAGTVALTLNSNVLTGTGTLWLDNVEAGDRIVLSKNFLRVKRVESNTRIIMWNYSNTTVSGQTYSIEKDNPIGFQLYPNPSSAQVIPYQGQMRVFDMVNKENDRPPFPEDFDVAILDGAESSRMRDTDDVKWIQKAAEYKGRITDLKATQGFAKPRTLQVVPDIPRRGTY